MRIGVIGAGALGLYYGAMLARAGNEVRFLLRRDYDAIRERGLSVRSVNGDFHLREIGAFRDAAEIGEVDLAVVGLKTFANDSLHRLLPPLVGPRTILLTLQNGLGNEDLLAELVGRERVVGGVAFLCSNRGIPGEVLHLGEGRVSLAPLVPEQFELAETVAMIFREAGVPALVSRDLTRIRWEKLVWNIPFNGLSALLRQDVAQLLARPMTRALVQEMMIEVIRAGNAQRPLEPMDEALAERMIAFTDPMGAYRPSMQIDRLEGRPLELEAIFGIPCARAEAAGAPMRLVKGIQALLQAGEPG